MAGKVLNYYAGGNTARGFYDLFDSITEGLEKVFILKGGPGTGKSTLLKKVASSLNQTGEDIELIHCASAPGSLDGVIFPHLKAGIFDGTAPHVIEPKAPGAIEEYVNLGKGWDSKKLAGSRDEILLLNKQRKDFYLKAHEAYAQALTIHDDWEKIYIDNMDFTKANNLSSQLIETMFSHIQLNKESRVVHRFLGAATPEGPKDFIQNLTGDVQKRYFIKGRPGSGKSTMLKKIAAAAQESGADTEVYHCGFDPMSVDMVIVREIGIAIFDSTSPHEYFPERETDEVVDMYVNTITEGTDEKYADSIKQIENKYKENMKLGTFYLQQAKKIHDQLEKVYIKAMDFKIIDQITMEIEEEIKNIL
ncbi:PRK06851 family protein [Thalassorhabdus alkalitolerans]|uniref:PRK06851 family protein n=1 Tax=Thalassorhabdus alkalitolerans TaxID=2282697 RepID=A0ABW0YPA7_9BACI